MTKIFVTGATGYIGGDALFAIVNAHPEYEITCLVRNSDKGAQVAAEYAKVKLVYGDLDSADLITKESEKADVVCHFANADHTVAANAIVAGLAARTAERPGFFIHTSGTGILLFTDIRTKTFGEASEKVYDDLEHVSEVTSLPDDAPHRHVDKIILAAGTDHSDRIKTAIVCPPTIYGNGRGPGNKISHQLPALCKSTIEHGTGIQVGAGKTYWGNVHVHDLSTLYLKLVEEAAHGGSTAEWEGKPALWGAEGYYFCENGEHVWGDISKKVAKEAKKQGLIETDEVKSLTPEEADKCTPSGKALWGANSRARAKRAREVLRWKPEGHSIEDDIADALKQQAKLIEAIPPHAKVAAGDM
ncbi:hypothetical protein LTR10_011959 [Elasticomyces elasticus]|nr:hypothetical protein LTR10_011959 [Elasticomyces elasticus]KAK4968900.1 hypothetical protein LTR42_009179 [Elasticomyces elasticus]